MIGNKCPTWPCPYCILEIRHSAPRDHAQDAWAVYQDEHERIPVSNHRMEIRRMAFEWLEEAFDKELPPAQVGIRPTSGGANKIPRSAASASAGSSTLALVPMDQVGDGSCPPPPPPPRARSLPNSDDAVNHGEGVSTPRHVADGVPWTGAAAGRFDDLMARARDDRWPQFSWSAGSQKSTRKKWTRYDPENEEIIRAAYLDMRESVEIRVDYDDDFFFYRINLRTMEQISQDSDYVRKVRIVKRGDETSV